MTLYLLLFMAPASFIPAYFDWHPLTWTQIQWIVILGGLATTAHLSLARSYDLAEISFLTPFGFARLLLSGIVGFVAFNEIPSSWQMWMGIGIICASIVLLNLDTRARKNSQIALNA